LKSGGKAPRQITAFSLSTALGTVRAQSFGARQVLFIVFTDQFIQHHFLAKQFIGGKIQQFAHPDFFCGIIAECANRIMPRVVY
jgi:hypothetical protein